MKNYQTIQSLNNQKGALLIVSMLMLFVLTILGVSSVSTSSLEGKMAVNFLQKTHVFQLVESEQTQVLNNGDQTNPGYNSANDIMIAAALMGEGGANTSDPAKSQFNQLDNLSVTVTSTATYQGETVCDEASSSGFSLGSSSSLKCNLFDIRTVATLSASDNTTMATEVHLQGINRKSFGN